MIARPLIVWDCRGGSTYDCLNRLCIGMAKGGFWVYIDEVNALGVALMSSLVSSILTIKNAIF
jgi:menaquinone-dependent protoporphyrinogen IX oxidase